MRSPLSGPKLKRRCGAGAVSFALLLIVFYFNRRAILTDFAGFLVVHDSIERAELIYVLNGDRELRPLKAAQLYNAGMGKTIAIARARESALDLPAIYRRDTRNDSALSEETLKRYGVPPSAIVELRSPGGVANTFDEARALADYMRGKAIGKVIVVTSEMHSRRARWIFRKIAGQNAKIMIASTDDPRMTPRNWWASDGGIVFCQNEYLKLGWYLVRY